MITYGLQCTSGLHVLVEFLPIPFHAKHWKVPALLRLTAVRVSCSLEPRTSLVSFRIQLIFGGGFPVALQWRVALYPSMIDVGHSKFRTRGSSMRKRKKILHSIGFFLYSSNSQTEMARSLFQLKFELSGLIWVKVKKGYFELKGSSS